MPQGWLVLLAMVFGLLVGIGFTAVVVIAHRRGQRAVAVVSTSVPQGVDEVIDALESVGVVLDGSATVVKASSGALTFGLVWNQALVHRELLELVDQVRRTGETITREVHLSRGPFGDANLRVLVRVARLGTRYVLLLAEDRTEAHRLEEVRRDFLANVSHELKTPIGAVSLLAEALEASADEPAEVQRFAKRLTVEAGRLSRLTQEIIELSRLQSGNTLQNAERVEIDAVIAQAVDRNRVGAAAHRISLVTGGDAGAEVYGDENMLITAVHNLVVNAIQYSSDGTRVGVGVSRADGVVEIAVTDQGPGIPDAERDRVFERFFRLDTARSRDTGGTGLGLSIVKHIVQNHGGDVRVWSQPGRGSTFTIRLPEMAATGSTTEGAASRRLASQTKGATP
ncbi:MAG: two-component sensor histidine kinase [Leifsonia sp.]|nr:two-component sensor histidine kinase [Leifsonia sp.]|tara:strand:+ start:39998 stop:41188 length:1191 start_codon:yes stop_codon:yes gene_type:complete